MKQRKNRRPFARPARSASSASASAAPVFQPLEPRKLLTTLHANPNLDAGETDTFYGWVAMPAWFFNESLDASSVEDRSIRLGIRLIDSNLSSNASVTILDLEGHPLFPWTGLQVDGSFSTDVDASSRIGPPPPGVSDIFWGSDDDETVSGFGLDIGYNPGWRVATDSSGNFLPGVWIPDGIFHSVRQLDWLEDEEPPHWDTDNVPDNFSLVIPETGSWDPGDDGFYETPDDSRMPIEFAGVFGGAGSDDRMFGTADDAWVGSFASDPFAAPNTMGFEPHLIERSTGWRSVDPNENTYADDGKADFNNGIGRIILSGTSITTRLIFFIVDDFADVSVVSTPFQEIESDRLGVAMNIDGSVYQAPAMGSIIIGNPTNADWTVNNPADSLLSFLPLGFQSYDRSSEGIIQEDPSLNETIGRIYIDGPLFGVTRLSGALERLQVGFFGGKMFVEGDLDTLNVAGDAGYYVVNGVETDTRAALKVGRVLGSFITGHNNSTLITVEGDFSPESITDKPFLRSDKVVVEQELDIFNAVEVDYARNFSQGGVLYALDAEGEQAIYLRNDTFGTAQYVGRETGLTIVTGVLGTDPGDDQHVTGDGGDDVDYYAIAVDGHSRLRIQMDPLTATLLTLQDAQGHILQSRGTDGTTGDIFYTPNQAGVLYIVVENSAGYSGLGHGYQMVISNAAPITLGEVRAAGSLRYSATDGSAIITEVGSIGTIRVGQDVNDDQNDATAPFIGNLLIQSGASIWNITSGGFIGGTVDQTGNRTLFSTVITAEENLAELLAGYGRNAEQPSGEGFAGGSIGALRINVRGDIGVIRALGTGGAGSDITTELGDIGGIITSGGTTASLTFIQTGGSIGVISAGNRIIANPNPNLGLRVEIGAGEHIDLIEAGAIPIDGFDLASAVGDGGVVDGQALITTGLGGNVRFFRAPHIWGNGVGDAVAFVDSRTPLTIVDDSGAIFTVRVSGNGSVASVRTHAIQSSVGVATVRIVANLVGSGNLTISNNSGNVEIGDVIVGGSAASRVIFDGSGRTDVYMIRAFGGINSIENRTSGDIVAIDADGLNTLKIKGNLGKTFSSTAVGPWLIGPEFELVVGTGGSTVGDPLLYDQNVGSGGDPYLAGAPFDPWLNGLAVRSARALSLVRVDGTIVDVYSELDIDRIIANADKQTPFGEFHGIEGTVYTPGSITRIDLGDGLVASGAGPFITGYIAAGGDVLRVEITGEGHNILGTITGAGFGTREGINRINATKGASIIGARITTNHLDHYFTYSDPPGVTSGDAGGNPLADIGRIIVKDGDIINSNIAAININQINIKGGIWDSNFLRADGALNTVLADEYMFSYVQAGGQNLITVIGDFNRLETQARNGDIVDLTVDVIGNLRSLKGRTLDGLSIDVDQEIRTVDAKSRIVRSFFAAGAITQFNAIDDITRVTFSVAGPVKQFRSRNSDITRLDFTIDGPDGRLDLMEANGSITGDIRVSGEIKTLRTKTGDIIASLETFSGDGFVRTLQSGRDLILTLDIDRDLDRVVVGRNFSGIDDEALKIRGDFGSLDVRGGTFDGSIIVEGSVTKKFNIMDFADGSQIIARGSINTIILESGMTGSIIAYTDGIKRLDMRGDFNGVITARNGALDNLNIFGGNAAGDIHADEGVGNVRITSAGALGGGSGNLTGSVTSDTDINRLDIDGDMTGGRVTALWDIKLLTVGGNVTGGSIIGAGATVTRVDIDGNVDSSFIVAGLDSLGDDNLLGGAAGNIDIFSSGDVNAVNIGGTINDVVIAAGVRSGSDNYATPDATTDLAPGLSNISNVRVNGAASGANLIIADTTISNVSVDGTARTVGNPGSNMGLTELDADPLNNGGTSFTEAAAVVFTDTDGDQITLSMRGAGTGMYTLAGGANGNLTGLVFNGTDSRTNVDIKVTAATGNGRVDLDNVNVQFADDAELSNLTITGNIDGTDGIVIDGSVNTITLQTVNTSGTIAVGGEAKRIAVNSVTAGSFIVTNLNTLDVLGGGFGGTVFSLDISTVNVRNGSLSGVIWGRDSIGTINNNSTGAVMDHASISTRGEIKAINANTVRNVTFISAGDLITNINISGDLVDSDILAGLSLGSDGRYDGTGTAADRLTAGTLSNLRINGSVIRSSVAVGVFRGTDRFYGTGDDIGSNGFGMLGRVDVSGTVLGSNFNSQHWAFTASQHVDQVRINGQDFIEQGNVTKSLVDASPLPLVVDEITTRLEADTLFIDIFFNEEVDISTILLDPNNPQAESAISFENPIDPNGTIPTPNDSYTILYDRVARKATIRFNRTFSLANPGIYTLVIDGAAIHSITGIQLDGNRDGVSGDSYMQNFLVGDAGDRVDAGTWDPDGDPNTLNDVDFLAASRLDLLLDDLVGGTGQKNHRLSFVGRIGDHPDTESLYFPTRFDVDVYQISLAAGDILQATLSSLVPGSAFVGSVTLRTAGGGIVGGSVAASQALLEEGFIETSGSVYYLTVAGTGFGGPPGVDELIDISNSTGMFTPPIPVLPIDPNGVSNDVGNYELNLLVFNDGNTGFSLATPTDIVDGEQFILEGFIGFDSNGVPSAAFGDVDVYDISRVLLSDNSHTTQLEEGMTLTVTLRLSDVGGDLGGRYEVGVFQTTETIGITDGLLMGAPTNLNDLGIFDQAGDATFTFRIPEAGTYAVMIQGNIQSNYELLVTIDTSTQGDRRASAEELNILLETNGGFAAWHGREGTTLHAFDLSGIGFKGLEAAVLSSIIEQVTDVYDAVGVTVHVSTNPADFVGEDFTTVFLANDFESGLFGIANTLDPQNQGKNDEAIVFVPTFSSLVAAGQVDVLSLALANVVAHEVAHTLGLRHAFSPSPFGPFGIMDTSIPPSVEHEFVGDPNDPYGTASALGDSWFFGFENEARLLQLIFDVDA